MVYYPLAPLLTSGLDLSLYTELRLKLFLHQLHKKSKEEINCMKVNCLYLDYVSGIDLISNSKYKPLTLEKQVNLKTSCCFTAMFHHLMCRLTTKKSSLLNSSMFKLTFQRSIESVPNGFLFVWIENSFEYHIEWLSKILNTVDHFQSFMICPGSFSYIDPGTMKQMAALRQFCEFCVCA